MRRWVIGLVLIGLLGIAAGVGVTVALQARDSGPGTTTTPRPSAATSDASPSASVDPGVTKAPSPELAGFYSQELAWEDCGDDQCASLEVPLDYADPTGETISLAILKRPASVPGERVGALVVNPGGPGAPGQWLAKDAPTYFGRPLTDAFDFVGFDPRGTGDSSPVDCLSDTDLDAYVAEDPDPDTPEETAGYVALARAFGQGCAARSGALAAHISTVEAARDLDVLRAALREPTLSYVGKSYGTKLGAVYADLFPDRVGRLVLDGALDVSLDPRDIALEQAAGFQQALEAYVQDCLDTSDTCFLGDSMAAGLQRVRDLMDQIDLQPLPAGDGRTLELGNAFYGIAYPLYSRDFWFLLTRGLKDALDGDGSTLLMLSDGYASRVASGGYSDNTMEANLAINCLDLPWSIPPRKVAGQLPAFEQASPVFGDAFAWGLVGCRWFPEGKVQTLQGRLAVGAAPIVVIGTTRDPATPMAWAEALSAQLDSGVLIRRDGDGHTGYHEGNACVDRAVEAYLVDGTVPTDGLSC